MSERRRSSRAWEFRRALAVCGIGGFGCMGSHSSSRFLLPNRRLRGDGMLTKWIQVESAQGESIAQGMGKLSRLGRLSFVPPRISGLCTEVGIRRGPSKARATSMMRGTRPAFSDPAGTWNLSWLAGRRARIQSRSSSVRSRGASSGMMHPCSGTVSLCCFECRGIRHRGSEGIGGGGAGGWGGGAG